MGLAHFIGRKLRRGKGVANRILIRYSSGFKNRKERSPILGDQVRTFPAVGGYRHDENPSTGCQLQQKPFEHSGNTDRYRHVVPARYHHRHLTPGVDRFHLLRQSPGRCGSGSDGSKNKPVLNVQPQTRRLRKRTGETNNQVEEAIVRFAIIARARNGNDPL